PEQKTQRADPMQRQEKTRFSCDGCLPGFCPGFRCLWLRHPYSTFRSLDLAQRHHHQGAEYQKCDLANRVQEITICLQFGHQISRCDVNKIGGGKWNENRRETVCLRADQKNEE